MVQLMAFLVVFVTGWALTSSLKGGMSKAKVLTLLIMGIAISFAGIILFVTGTFQVWFPKTAIYKSSVFFSERYSAAIGFWALIISLISLIPVILALTSLGRRN